MRSTPGVKKIIPSFESQGSKCNDPMHTRSVDKLCEAVTQESMLEQAKSHVLKGAKAAAAREVLLEQAKSQAKRRWLARV
jgi:hypothetical protein